MDGYDNIFPGTEAMNKKYASDALVVCMIPAKLSARQANILLNALQMGQTKTQEHPDGHGHERNVEVSKMIEEFVRLVLKGERGGEIIKNQSIHSRKWEKQ